MRTQVKFSTTYHPQIGQFERTIHTIEDILRACVMDFIRNWDQYLSLIEFSYSNNYHLSIQMALYGGSVVHPFVGMRREKFIVGPKMIKEITEKVKMIKKKLLKAQSRQTSYYDLKKNG